MKTKDKPLDCVSSRCDIKAISSFAKIIGERFVDDEFLTVFDL